MAWHRGGVGNITTKMLEALRVACEENNAELVLQLIQNKSVDITQSNKDEKGYTPLHIACIKNSLKVAKILIKNGADVNADIGGTTSSPYCGGTGALPHNFSPSEIWCSFIC
eukprot:Phypoly_transcript_20527.p2 GENE.Phypoly_transcript_20527~~Phypoly_transcript_20527.p2  ORF type:complete len:125 (+),score=20.45 Phypoly_transcript_20527:42-377(+)